MINIEKLEKLYDGVIDGVNLTTKQLNDYGFNSTDINSLIDENIIKRVKRGYYSFIDVDKLLYYGKKIYANKEYDRANSCFERCYEIDPNNLSVCFQLFIRGIQSENYNRTFELFDKLYNSDNKFYNIDANFYLYLLSYITEVPEKYREQAKFINYSDIKISNDDKRYSDTLSYNRVRVAAMKGKLPFAYKLLNEIVVKNGKHTVQDVVEKSLLSRAIVAENKSRKTVLRLVKDKKYEDVINHLEDKRNRHDLNVVEEYIEQLSQIYLKVLKTSTIPRPKIVNTNNLFDAISANRFDLALEINSDYNKQRNISNEDNTLYLIISDICELINELKNNNIRRNSEKVDKLSKVDDKKDVLSSISIDNNEGNISTEEENNKLKSDVDNYFLSIISNLMNNDIESALKYLKKHLDNIGKSEYEYIITNLVKLSALEGDIAFTLPMVELSLMSNPDYVININNYIQKFYICLSEKKLEEAKIYLDIINNASKINNNSLKVDGLYKVLDSYQKSKDNENTINAVQEQSNSIQNNVSNSEQEIPDTTIVDNQEQARPTDDEDSIDSYYEGDEDNNNNVNSAEYIRNQNDIKFIEKKHDELIKNKGIIILNPMDDKDRINFILNEADKYLDISVFSIVDEGKTRIVLKYNDLNYEDFDAKALISEAVDDYKNRNYAEALTKQIKILETNTKQNASNYAMIGLAYLKLFNIPKAIEYLTVANYLAKQENSDRDYGDLLLKLKGEIDEDDIKPKVVMKQADFKNDNAKFYGIKKFDELNSYICESGLDVETACRNLNMSDEQIDVVKLIYAREYYTMGNNKKGELFLKSYEKSKHKTRKTKSIYNYIQHNKKFYKNRNTEAPRQLSLKLVPKK